MAVRVRAGSGRMRFTGIALVLALVAPMGAASGRALADERTVARIDAEPSSSSQLSQNALLDRVFADEMRISFALDPLGALQQGQKVSTEQFLMLFTPELAAERRDANAEILERLARIDPAQLDEGHRISRAVMEDAKRTEQALLSPESQTLIELRPFNHFGGFHVAYPELSSPGSGVALETTGDYELLIARHRVLGRVFDNAIARFREGMAAGVTEPRLTVDNMVAQIDALLAQPMERSPFMSPARSFPRRAGG